MKKNIIALFVIYFKCLMNIKDGCNTHTIKFENEVYECQVKPS